MNLPSFRITEEYLWQKLYTLMDSQIHGKYNEQKFNSAIVSVSYDGLYKCLKIIFSMSSVHIDLFACPCDYYCISHTAYLMKMKLSQSIPLSL